MNGISIPIKDKDIEDVLDEELDLLMIDELENKTTLNKCLYSTAKNSALVTLFTTKEFRVLAST